MDIFIGPLCAALIFFWLAHSKAEATKKEKKREQRELEEKYLTKMGKEFRPFIKELLRD